MFIGLLLFEIIGKLFDDISLSSYHFKYDWALIDVYDMLFRRISPLSSPMCGSSRFRYLLKRQDQPDRNWSRCNLVLQDRSSSATDMGGDWWVASTYDVKIVVCGGGFHRCRVHLLIASFSEMCKTTLSSNCCETRPSSLILAHIYYNIFVFFFI